MKKIIIICIFTLISAVLYGQSNLNLKGTYSPTNCNGLISARDAAFHNDTCYLISGDGRKVLMAKSNGTPLTSNFSNIIFNQALNIYVDDTYVLVLDWDNLRFYTKSGVTKYSIPTSSERYQYFWVKNKQEIMLVADNKISIYNYSTRALIKSYTPPYRFTSNGNNSEYFTNDGVKLYDFGSKFYSYEYRGGTLQSNNLTTTKYKTLKEEQNYLACFVGNESLWFNYFDRSKAFFVDSGFNVVRNCNSFLPASKNPTSDDLYNESGDPNLKVYYSQGKIYVINILPTKVEFYMLE